MEWEDLDTPLLSALAARLLFYTTEENNYIIPTSSDIEGQASLNFGTITTPQTLTTDT